jgi:SulP family sulfate permease
MSPAPSQPVASKVINQAVEGLTDVADYLRLDPVPPFWRQIRVYSLDKLKADAFAGLMVAIVAIPQALAFALIAGLPVETVLTASVIGSLFFSLWSSSRHTVFGPTNTISVILASALAATAAIPLNALQKVVMLAFMIGVVQLGAGVFKLGNLSHFISRTVIVAYSTGAAVLIVAGQLTNFLGIARPDNISLPGVLRHVISSLAHFRIQPISLGIGAAALLLMLWLRKRRQAWPEGLLVLGLFGALTAAWEYTCGHTFIPDELSLSGLGVKLVRDVGEVSGTLPLFQGFPIEHALTFIPQVSSIALAAALLGMLETLTIAQTMASRSGQKINPNQELMSAGLGNLFCSAFGTMACSSSFLRSAIAFESRGATQLGPMLSSVFLLAIIMATAALVNFIPVTALAAYIILLAIRLAASPESRIVRRATSADALVFWVTLSATLFLSLDTAIYIGMGLSLALFLHKAAAPSLVEYSFNAQGQLSRLEGKEGRSNPAIAIVHVEGELFFAAADLFQEQIRQMAEDPNLRAVILRMKNARHLDATSVISLLQLHDFLTTTQRHLIISGLDEELMQVLRRSGALDRIGADNIFPAEANLTLSTKRALQRATQLIGLSKSQRPELRIAYDRRRAEQFDQADATARREDDYHYDI